MHLIHTKRSLFPIAIPSRFVQTASQYFLFSLHKIIYNIIIKRIQYFIIGRENNP